jgi:dipeptidase
LRTKAEVWHFEIVGPGKGKIGSVWAAQRVPDGHIAVNANASTIKEMNLADPEHFMASENIYSVARDAGWWNEEETLQVLLCLCHRKAVLPSQPEGANGVYLTSWRHP